MSTTILDLPTEVIAYIFTFVSHKKDRRNSALICKKFHKIVRQQSKRRDRIDLVCNQQNSPLSTFEQSEDFPFQKLRLDDRHFEQFRDLWLRHGAEITQMTLRGKWEKIQTLGSDFKELFPNLKVFKQEELLAVKILLEGNSEQSASKFSENIEEIHLCLCPEAFKELKSILMLFPGLRRLKLKIKFQKVQTEAEVKEFKDFLGEWLLKLDRIELSFLSKVPKGVRVDLFNAFDGWNHEKVFFDDFRLHLIKENLEILEKFFSIPRHIKSLMVYYVGEVVSASDLFALIDKNATIDRLSTHVDNEMKLVRLEGLYNARGVKEVHFVHGFCELIGVRFTQEALLKVTEIQGFSPGFDLGTLRLPLFRNLRILNLCHINIGDAELDLIVESFPLLEEFQIFDLAATEVGFSNLKRLQFLEIGNAFDLSEDFYEFAFELPELIHLKIYNAANLNLDGIESIVMNCQKIETIFFLGCDEINEACIEFIAKYLFYIRKIDLIECENVFHGWIERIKREYPSIEIYA